MTKDAIRTMPHDFTEQEHMRVINDRGIEIIEEILLECKSIEVALRVYVNFHPKKEVKIYRKMRVGSEILALDVCRINELIAKMKKGKNPKKLQNSNVKIKKHLLKQHKLVKPIKREKSSFF